MWRISLTLFVLLSSIISAMLFWQWNAYSEMNETEGQSELIGQEVTVFSNNQQLKITQVFKGLLAEKEYTISLPDKVENWDCLKEDGSPCDSLDENPSTFIPENNRIKMVYHLSLEGNPSSFLLNEWLGTLANTKIINSRVEVIDSSRRTGTWVVGLPFKGFKELDLIDYYVYEGREAHPSIYYQSSPLTYVKGDDGLEFYHDSAAGYESFSFPKIKELPDYNGTAIILTDTFSETNGTGLMISEPNISEKLLERRIVNNYFLERARNLPLEERWLLDVLTSLVTGQDSHVDKGKMFIEELERNLREEELEMFLADVKKAEEITPERMDELLGELFGKSTHFFAMNRSEETPLIPLYFYDKRTVYLADAPHEDLEILLVEGEKLFPFVDTMKGLGFDMKVLSDEETILLSKGNNSYRFFQGQNYFIYNEEDYGLLENPLRSFNGMLYIESSWVQSLFKVTISENETEVRLSLDY